MDLACVGLFGKMKESERKQTVIRNAKSRLWDFKLLIGHPHVKAVEAAKTVRAIILNFYKNLSCALHSLLFGRIWQKFRLGLAKCMC